MNPLDNDSILTLSRILKQGTHNVPLYAVEYEHTVVATNNAWLMEWPKELVDMGCPRLARLFAKHKHKDVTNSATKLLDKHWTDVLFHASGKYAGVEECEPPVEGYEDNEDTILIRHRKEIIPYNWVNFEATELFSPNSEYRIYIPPKEQNMAKIMKLLVIYDDVGRIGVFSNNAP